MQYNITDSWNAIQTHIHPIIISVDTTWSKKLFDKQYHWWAFRISSLDHLTVTMTKDSFLSLTMSLLLSMKRSNVDDRRGLLNNVTVE